MNEVGFCLMSLGRLDQAKQFLERAYPIMHSIMNDLSNASRICLNHSELYALKGDLDQSVERARLALELSIEAKDKEEERNSVIRIAIAEHLMGDLAAASNDFKKVEALERINCSNEHLYGLKGIQHADHLMRIGDEICAQEVTRVNLAICESMHWLADISRCHRVLGDLKGNAGDHNNARKHYNEALKIVREITYRQVLIETLLARGRWSAKHMKNAIEAFDDLDEALDSATTGGFRILEADIRVALAWANLAAGNNEKAKAEAMRAKQMSDKMGYYWGKKDADEVLTEIEKA